MRGTPVHRRTWQTVLKTAAAGVAAVSVLLVLAAPLRAQAPQLDGVEPCLATHFDPARYLADLGALGWQPIAPSTRPAALAWLSDAFLPLSEQGFDYAAPGDLDARRATQLQRWTEMTDGRNILVRGRQVLFIGGDATEDGHRRVSCWLAAPSGDALITRLFGIWTDAGFVSQGQTVARGGIPDTALPTGGTLSVRGVRAAADAAPQLSAHEGLLIRVVIGQEATQ